MNLTELKNGSMVDENDPGEPGHGSRRVSITALEGHLLRDLARGRDVLEIGTGLGVSTSFLASSAREVWTLDIDPWVHENVWPWLREDYSNVKTYDWRPERFSLTQTCSMAFIDGEHTIDALEEDLAYVRQFVKQGIIAVHDTITVGELREVLENEIVGWLHIPTTHGISLQFIGYDA